MKLLFIHGFTGYPIEWEGVERYLRARLPRDQPPEILTLRGHGPGATAERIAEFHIADWEEQIEERLSSLMNEQVAIAGQSLGGLLALKVWLDRGCHFPAAGLAMPFASGLAGAIVKWLARLNHRIAGDRSWILRKPSAQPAVDDPAVRRALLGAGAFLRRLPVLQAAEVLHLAAEVHRRLLAVRALPRGGRLFLGHGTLDKVAGFEAASSLANHLQAHLGAAFCFRVYAHSNHVLTVDRDRAALAGDLEEFFLAR